MKPRDKYAAEGLTAHRQRVVAKSGRRLANDAAVVARVAAALDETPTSASVFDDLWGRSGKSLVNQQMKALVKAHSDRIDAAMYAALTTGTGVFVQNPLSAVGLDPNIAYSAADLCA